VAAAIKEKKKKLKMFLKDVALVAGTLQNLSNLYSLDIYGSKARSNNKNKWKDPEFNPQPRQT
jgi:hypothetical protein